MKIKFSLLAACVCVVTSNYGACFIELDGANPSTNECHAVFADPGATAFSLPPPTPLLAISAGAYHSLALKADGSVIGWGLDDFGEASPPASATNVVAISAGGYQSLALRADGSMVSWGLGGMVVSETETDFVAIAAGYSFSMALKSDRTVIGWGDYYYGTFYPFTIPASATNLVAIAAGYAHSLGLKVDGLVIGWGDNGYGQTTIPTNATNIVALAAGATHSLALKADGKVVAWGGNLFGQLDIPAEATNIVAISAGGLHNMALRGDGKLFVWGLNGAGQTNVPPNATNIVEISAGYYDCLARTVSGLVIGWGGNYYDQSAVPGELNTNYLPVTVSGVLNTDVPGTYSLTYSATNSVGESATTTRTVVVMDTTPPEMVCPANMVIDFTGSGGAIANFSAQATDLCSGETPVFCAPSSGSNFPIGTNPVVCIANDESGNRNHCSFIVVVLGASGVTSDVRAEMTTLRTTIWKRHVLFLDAAIASLTRSVAGNLWLDETHLNTRSGGSVFINEQTALLMLSVMSEMGNSPVAKTVLKSWGNRLVHADRLLALVELDSATAAGANKKQLSNAVKALAEGDRAAGDQQYSAAIQNYQTAWKQAAKLVSQSRK